MAILMLICGRYLLNSATSMQICAKQVSKVMMQKLEKETMILVCKMETIFPPGWFNAMEHFLVHLP
jgi:hypothetical protein